MNWVAAEELEGFLPAQDSALKLTKALSAQPAPPKVVDDTWMELKIALLFHCQDVKHQELQRKKKLRRPDDFQSCGENEVELFTHRRSRSFCLHLIFDAKAQRIRWHSGERHDEFSVAIIDGKPCLLSRLYEPYYTIEEAARFLYHALTWARH